LLILVRIGKKKDQEEERRNKHLKKSSPSPLAQIVTEGIFPSLFKMSNRGKKENSIHNEVSPCQFIDF